MRKFIVVFLSLFICLLIPIPSEGLSSGEINWLRNLYIATNGSEWNNNSGWSGVTGANCLSFGVTCTGHGDTEHVSRLDLHDNNLSGTLPQANIHSNLPDLEYLNLNRACSIIRIISKLVGVNKRENKDLI